MPVEKQLADIQDGDVLAEDVLDARGGVLLGKGTKLTRAHLQLLERRAVTAASVALPGEEGAGPASVDAARLAQCLERQERVFAKVRTEARMEAIYQTARQHLTGGNLPPA